MSSTRCAYVMANDQLLIFSHIIGGQHTNDIGFEQTVCDKMKGVTNLQAGSERLFYAVYPTKSPTSNQEVKFAGCKHDLAN